MNYPYGGDIYGPHILSLPSDSKRIQELEDRIAILTYKPTAPPPPSSIEKPIAFYDTECYPNYWLLKFRPRGMRAYTFCLLAGQWFTSSDIERIKLLFDAYKTVSFNGNYYDIPQITAALCGYTTEQLKWQNDRIIIEKVKPWELGLPEWRPLDHIDVMEVAPGAGSQKQYAGRIHCKKMQDLPYDPSAHLSNEEIEVLTAYCENDLDVLESLYDALAPQIKQRERLGERYGIDLRSKSDAQVAEAVLKRRCEQTLGRRIFKPEIDWNLKFRYKVPHFIQYQLPQLQQALELVRESVFGLGANGSIEMPPQLDGRVIVINQSSYKMGIGGLHSQETQLVAISNETHQLRMPDVASYYPNLMLNSGEYPPALGPAFLQEFAMIKNERLEAKKLQAQLKKAGDKKSPKYKDAEADNEGGKIMINGTFGKTGSIYSVLFAPTMLIQTTVTGQLSLLMLIEWHELNGIPVISANTDGIVINCPRDRLHISDAIIKEWENRTGLEMEVDDYVAIYARDVNNYFAIKTPEDVKRKGEYAPAGLIAKKNPDVEICADAAAEFLAKGTSIEYTIAACRDLTKFVTIQKVNGGGVKLWGEGPRKGALVRDIVPILEANGWEKQGRKWCNKEGVVTDPNTAYKMCFAPQRPEYLGKVVRWYYGTQSPGPIVYATNGNTVSLSYGARPCMILPDEFPTDIDYNWYITKAYSMLKDIGYYNLT